VGRRGKTRCLKVEEAFRMKAFFLQEQPANKVRSQLSCELRLIRIDRPRRLLESRDVSIGVARCTVEMLCRRYEILQLHGRTSARRPTQPKLIPYVTTLSTFNNFTRTLIGHHMDKSALFLIVLIIICHTSMLY
jgi:hypothetical protein